MRWTRHAASALALVVALNAKALTDDEQDALRQNRQINRAAVAAWDAEQAESHGDDPDILLRPGLVANRHTRTVTFFGETTGLAAVDPIEFFIIGADSGHDYETVAVALTRPRYIREGLVFLGLPPGHPADPRRLRFWPKGERVIVTIDGMRAETLILNRDEQAPLPPSGLVFTGSHWIETDDGDRQLAADVSSPFAVAANYNEPNAILDVPWQAAQQAMYQRQTLNPDKPLVAGQRVRIEMQPEYEDGRRRVLDMTVTVLPPDPESDPDVIRAAISADAAPDLDGTRSLAATLDIFRTLVADGRDPFVTLRFAPDLPLERIKALATLFGSLDAEHGIRVDPPVEGELYYRAFAPGREMLNRERRLSHPWELTLARDTESEPPALTLDLTWIEQVWGDDPTRPKQIEHRVPVPTPDALPEALQTVDTKLPVLLVHAPADLTHGELMTLLRPVQTTYPMIHVFTAP